MNQTPGGEMHTSAVSALVSLLALVLSFFDHPHVWLQNLTLLVSLIAGLIAILAGLKKWV
jgi:hypothetical protein